MSNFTIAGRFGQCNLSIGLLPQVYMNFSKLQSGIIICIKPAGRSSNILDILPEEKTQHVDIEKVSNLPWTHFVDS